jgi:hypothetical protein
MLVSPPAGTGSVHKSGLLPANLTYFNLHGLPDTAEWYGQKDLDSDQDDPDYPVALSIKDISTNGQAPRLVFSEACYGAHIDDKEESKSLALHFLANGTLAMVGSTCISYGSVSTPLIGADLFGQVFWKQIHTGQTVGEAFLQAKISLVQEMNQRQGYLDGEDQKTLISFVLYGDPLVTLNEKGSKQKSLIRPREYPTVKTINDHSAQEIETEKVSIDLVAQTKKIVQQYLPAYQDAEIQYSQYNPSTLIATNPYADSSVVTKVKKSMVGRQTKIVLNKSVKVARHNHQHYARITLDDHGRMVKLVVSR